ncbi:MAG TPA: hypothetical protein PLX85_00080 [Dehalococcoidia bacterium]|nr:hypothetical protein [Dehalococcoidia bacterium]
MSSDFLVTSMASLRSMLRAGAVLNVKQMAWSGAWAGISVTHAGKTTPVHTSLWLRLYRRGGLQISDDRVSAGGERTFCVRLAGPSSAPPRSRAGSGSR